MNVSDPASSAVRPEERDVIENCLERVLASGEFGGSARAQRFLRFCVHSWLDGRSEQIKETTIGLEVFDRQADYDPKVDPIVRVYAGRLRTKLERYYAQSGARDPVRVELPRGTYVPTIRWIANSETAEVQRQAPAVEAVPLKRRLPIVTIAAAMALIALAGSYLIRLRGGSASAPAVVTPLVTMPGVLRDPAWSRDGRLLAFSWKGPSELDAHVFVQETGGVEKSAQPAGGADPVRQTQRPEAEFRPVFGPAPNQLAFLRQAAETRFDVVILDRERGVERVVATTSLQTLLPNTHPALDWSPDGRFLVTSEGSEGGGPARLKLIDIATGAKRELTSPLPGTTGDLEARFSPDGRWVAFRRGGVGDLRVVELSTLRETPLTEDNPGVRGVEWTADGGAILFGSLRPDGGFGIHRWDLKSRTKTLLTPQLWDSMEPRLEPASGRVVMISVELDTELGEISLADGRLLRTVASSTREEGSPIYSPDGSMVAFDSTRSGGKELWVARRDGTAARRLTAFNGRAIPMTPSWSRDGKQLIYSVRELGRTDIEELDVESLRRSRLQTGPGRNIEPQYSPDGQFIFYESNESGRHRVWRMGRDGRRVAVVDGAALQFRLSDDGKEIFYLDQGDGEPPRLMSRVVETAETKALHTFRDAPAAMSWQVLRGTLYYVATKSSYSAAPRLEAVDLQTGNARSFGLPPGTAPSFSALSIAPDGKTALVQFTQHERTQISRMQLPGR